MSLFTVQTGRAERDYRSRTEIQKYPPRPRRAIATNDNPNEIERRAVGVVYKGDRSP